eukprot:3138386-Prymnesium_polylepis.2
MRQIVRPHRTEPTGFGFKCPLCRAECGLSRLHLMVLMKGSWDASTSMFQNTTHVREWVNRDKPVRVAAV